MRAGDTRRGALGVGDARCRRDRAKAIDGDRHRFAIANEPLWGTREPDSVWSASGYDIAGPQRINLRNE